ncbi:protein FAR-RED IMPAIRED RESPONSE 1-like [Chenopodium quinoa]|uniref:protein FAR-RED IMPAIRED RESPONSE 1-like n=1 Tax=Chenopodium quinoa TaxID=63459 RepID=UPI000B79A373|nr:protein FAR-RED IMPAIRED RESPONSE 1-like [Chenopodium quinoa]
MAMQRNGLEDMSFEQKDLHDEVAKQKKLVFEQGDAKVMFDYFKRMVEDNDKFFHTYRVDEEGKLKDVLRVDARSRAAYEEFGDVVVFDSTYLTNEYKLPFCNFVGVNHHGETILLGCALVSWETTKTFEWVFSSWLRCMGDKAPIGILTDQDQAMRKALKAVMKGTTHRWCIWHILNKFGQKIGKRVFYPELKMGLHQAVYDGLDYTLLHEFVERYEEALSVREKTEKKTDDNNARHVRKTCTDFPAELIFQKIYTDAKFKEVQRECTRMMYVSVIERRQVSDHVIEHVIEDRVWYKPQNSRKEIPSKR